VAKMLPASRSARAPRQPSSCSAEQPETTVMGQPINRCRELQQHLSSKLVLQNFDLDLYDWTCDRVCCGHVTTSKAAAHSNAAPFPRPKFTPPAVPTDDVMHHTAPAAPSPSGCRDSHLCVHACADEAALLLPLDVVITGVGGEAPDSRGYTRSSRLQQSSAFAAQRNRHSHAQTHQLLHTQQGTTTHNAHTG
jgi:hypothetical protein